MESISSLTKKHCHCAFNIICGILMIILTAVSIFAAITSVTPLSVTYLLITAAVTLAGWLHIAGLKIGCSLMKIPLAIVTIILFSASLLISAVGFMFITHSNSEDYINAILADYGYKLTITTQTVGIFFIIGGVILLLLSFWILAGVRYFNSVKKCLEGEIKRSGAKIFGVASIVMFVLISAVEIIYAVLLVSHNTFNELISTTSGLIFLSRLILTDILMLCIGIAANSFGNKTYAYKVFENQMMKVETNADGTVYVPISEESPFANSISNSSEEKNNSSISNESNQKHKSYIPEGQISPRMSEKAHSEKIPNESDII